MIKKSLIVVSIFLMQGLNGSAQSYNIKLMTWNVLNYPSVSAMATDTTLRNPNYRTVIQYVLPDVLVTQENSNSSSVSMFLNNIMNNASIGGGNQYSSGTYINGPDSDNGIFYRTSLFQFVSNTPVQTALRDFNEFKLVHLATGDTIRIISCHLKAGSASADSITRGIEVDQLRAYTNTLTAGTDFILCGDFNIYGNGEISYQKLIQNNSTDDGNLVDPLNLQGYWNSYSYRFHHTQSTRTRSFGNGSTGGLDDRFDMILYSTAVSQPGGVTFVQGSTVPIGNDGFHYNDSINDPPNTAVPVNIANALHASSDHLPVTSIFTFATATGIHHNNDNAFNLSVSPNPAHDKISINYYLSKTAEVEITIYDMTGKLIQECLSQIQSTGNHSVQVLLPKQLLRGAYNIQFMANKMTIENKILIIEK